jgi:hypothetical protein
MSYGLVLHLHHYHELFLIYPCILVVAFFSSDDVYTVIRMMRGLQVEQEKWSSKTVVMMYTDQ